MFPFVYDILKVYLNLFIIFSIKIIDENTHMISNKDTNKKHSTAIYKKRIMQIKVSITISILI